MRVLTLFLLSAAACGGGNIEAGDVNDDGADLSDADGSDPVDAAVGADAPPGWPDGDVPPLIDASADAPDAGVVGAIDASVPANSPDWQSEMTSSDEDQFESRAQPEGAVTRHIADGEAVDGRVATLRFPGLPGLGNNDRVGPGFASELYAKQQFHFGTYRMRIKLAACTPGEEVVNGLFTYFNDGNDHDGDGIADNSEIDIEILCGSPQVMFMTVYTDYSPVSGEFRKWTRAVDFATGDIWAAPTDYMYGIDKIGNDPSLKIPGFLDPGKFIEVGFEWRNNRVRYFATIDGNERTLADLTDSTHVPQLPGLLMFNVWHSRDHWFGGGGPPDYPAQDATLSIDWVRFWQ